MLENLKIIYFTNNIISIFWLFFIVFKFTNKLRKNILFIYIFLNIIFEFTIGIGMLFFKNIEVSIHLEKMYTTISPVIYILNLKYIYKNNINFYSTLFLTTILSILQYQFISLFIVQICLFQSFKEHNKFEISFNSIGKLIVIIFLFIEQISNPIKTTQIGLNYYEIGQYNILFLISFIILKFTHIIFILQKNKFNE